MTCCLAPKCPAVPVIRATRTDASGKSSAVEACAAHTDLLHEQFLAIKYGTALSLTIERIEQDCTAIIRELLAKAGKVREPLPDGAEDEDGWTRIRLVRRITGGTSDKGEYALYCDTSDLAWTFDESHFSAAERSVETGKPLRVRFTPRTHKGKLFRNVIEVR